MKLSVLLPALLFSGFAHADDLLPTLLTTRGKLLVENKGNEMVGTVDGQSLTGSHPLIASEKHSVMFVMGVEGSVRDFKAWEALPNADWATNKAKLTAASSK